MRKLLAVGATFSIFSLAVAAAFAAEVRSEAPAKAAGAQRRAAEGTRATKAEVVPAGRPRLNVVGTIQYDNGVAASRRGTDGGTVGNLFAPAAGAHSINAVTFKLAGNYGASVVMTVWDENPGSLMVLRRQLVAGIPASTNGAMTFMAALMTPVLGHTGNFVGGIRNTDYDPCAGNVALGTTCDGVALSMGGVDPGMGFHAIRVPFNDAMFVPTVTMVAGAGSAIANVNAIFRVTGDALPIELTKFAAD